MRKLLIVATLILLYGCKSGYIDKELKGNLFDKFDYELWKNRYKNHEEGIQYGAYIYKDVEFYPTISDNPYIYVYPQKQQFYTIYNEYYISTFHLKQRGKIFGNGHDCCIDGTIETLKIGIWYQYDEQGKLIKETDEDKKFGKFGYNELLQFLDKEKQINLHKGVKTDKVGGYELNIRFYYSDSSDKKLWEVIVKKGEAYQIMSESDGERVEQNAKFYFIDGNTGAVLGNTKEEQDFYKEIGFSYNTWHTKPVH